MTATMLTDRQIAAHARKSGFSGKNLLHMLAIVFGESSGRPDAVGDQDLTTSTWGPSLGLAQIRCLWGQRGTGRPRDCDELANPQFNLDSAWQISTQGRSFAPWSVWKSGEWREHLPRAWEAITGSKGGAGDLDDGGPGGGEPTGLTGAVPGGGLVDQLVEPAVGGLRRVVIWGALVAGGVVLVAAGGWRTTRRGTSS